MLENVAALAISFAGELKDQILLGTNVTNNWKFTISRQQHEISATEELTNYRYCYNRKGEIMAFQYS
ncbi:MAG: hypothetical protein FWG65_04545 [Turicibacter sp.]|nr:hypothetical protein [Turicibacter sp.]